MDICQHQISYKMGRVVRTAACLALLAACPGCLHLREQAPRWPAEQSLRQRPAPAGEARHHLALALMAAALALSNLGWSWARRRRLTREGLPAGPAAALDREDLALIRTARDALRYLVRKQLARLRVVSLADYRQRRAPPG